MVQRRDGKRIGVHLVPLDVIRLGKTNLIVGRFVDEWKAERLTWEECLSNIIFLLADRLERYEREDRVSLRPLDSQTLTQLAAVRMEGTPNEPA